MNDIRDHIIDAALEEAVFDGWTASTLERAAKRAGLDAFDVKRTFPGGVIEALNYHSRRGDQRMLAALAALDLPAMKIRERIAIAVMVRLRQNFAHREAIRRATAVFALPWHAADGVKNLYATVDAMWRAAGDTSTDYNFYTKRLLLSKVYSTTFSVWLDDPDETLAETQAFLHRRIENVMQIEKLKARAIQGLGKLEGWLPKKFGA